MAKPEGLRVGGAGTAGTADNTQIKKPKKHRKAQNSVWSRFGEPLGETRKLVLNTGDSHVIRKSWHHKAIFYFFFTPMCMAIVY